MNVEVVATDHLAERAATVVAELLRDAVKARGTATFAVSGGSTPARMFSAMLEREVPWEAVHLLQVDERIAPDGHAARNLVGLEHALLNRLPRPPAGVHPMPVAAIAAAGDADDATTAAATAAGSAYGTVLQAVAGDPPVLDVVHLGLGDDGHTASLVPGDPVLDVVDRAVAGTGAYRGYRRLTLTAPVLKAARHQVWLIAGVDKRPALRRLFDDDPAIPATRVATPDALVLTDPAAAAGT